MKKTAAIFLSLVTAQLALLAFSQNSHAGCKVAAYESAYADISNFTAYSAESCTGSSSGGGGGRGYTPPPASPTPTPTPPPTVQVCEYLQAINVNLNQTYFQTHNPAPYLLDIQYAMDLWKNVLNCPTTVLSQVSTQYGPAPAHTNTIEFVPQSQMSAACPAWANETDADLNLVARVCFTENYGTDQNNPQLQSTTRFKIVVNSDKSFATSDLFCFAGTCYPNAYQYHWLFQTVISHELGHAMGLDDTYITSATNPDYSSIMNTYLVGTTGRWAPTYGLPSNFDGQTGHTAIGCN